MRALKKSVSKKKKRCGVNLPRPSSAAPARRAHAFRRWVPTVLIAILLLVLWRVDVRLKAHDLTGFAPGEVDVLFASNDFADSWQALEQSHLYERVMAESPEPISEFFLEARKATGIRWTPSRWRRWFGERLVVARTGEAFGLCMRPGILARVALAVAGRSGEESGIAGVGRWRGFAYTWRDGFLIASASAEFVSDAVASDAQRVRIEAERPGLHLHWGGDAAGRLRVDFADRVEIEGWVDLALEPVGVPLGLSGVWPDGPMFSISGGRADDLIRLVADKVPDFPGLELVAQAFEELEGELPAGWDDGTDEFSLALIDVDQSEFLVVPKLALVSSGEGPLKALVRPGGALAYNWSGLSGWMRPWLGEKLSTCVVSTEGIRIFATQERVMASLAGNLMESDSIDADVAARVDLTRLAIFSEEMYRRAAEHELLARMNEEDVEREVIPLLEALKQFGVLLIEGVAFGDGVSFSGVLHVPPDESKS